MVCGCLITFEIVCILFQKSIILVYIYKMSKSKFYPGKLGNIIIYTIYRNVASLYKRLDWKCEGNNYTYSFLYKKSEE